MSQMKRLQQLSALAGMGLFALGGGLSHAQSACSAGQTSAPFAFTGGAQTYVVPAGFSSAVVYVNGAQGGTGATGGNGSAGGTGALGAQVVGTLALTTGQTLNVIVGGQGAAPTGGFNGGANGGSQNSGGGGGASDIRIGGVAEADRVVTAGGGGGGGRGGCEASSVVGGNGGPGGGGAGVNGVDAPTPGGVAGGGQGGNAGGVDGAPGPAGIGCGGFLGSPGGAASTGTGGSGGAGQTCCCFGAGSIPGGGGGGGGQLGGGGGGGGSAGTTGCSGNDKGAGGGGGGGTSFIGSLTGVTSTPGVTTGNGSVELCLIPTTFTVTPSVSGGNGTAVGGGVVTINTTSNVTITPDAGFFTVLPVGGTCGGSLSGNTFTTDPVIADCTVVASFTAAITPAVAPSPPAGGSIVCTAQTVLGGTSTCTVVANSGYAISSISGCGGTPSSSSPYVTGPMQAACVVSVAFARTVSEQVPVLGGIWAWVLAALAAAASGVALRRRNGTSR